MSEVRQTPRLAEPAPLRETTLARRRLTYVLAATATGLAVKFGAPPVVHAIESPHEQAPAHCKVTVQPHDTLWDIAKREAPDRDPRLEVADIRRLNHLPTADVQAGQVLELCTPLATETAAAVAPQS